MSMCQRSHVSATHCIDFPTLSKNVKSDRLFHDPDMILSKDLSSVDRAILVTPLFELDPVVISRDIMDAADKWQVHWSGEVIGGATGYLLASTKVFDHSCSP